MIVSFSRNFAFVAVPRTGTHAVRTALRPHLAPSDWEQCTRYERRLCPAPAIAAIGHGHLTAAELRSALIPGLWERMFSFAFVREPLARFASAFLLLHRDHLPGDAAAVRQRMKDTLRDPEQMAHILYRPQRDFVLDREGSRLVSLIARHDRLAAELEAICERLELPPPQVERVNAARYPEGFEPDEELRALCEHLYALDYEWFETLGEAGA